VYIPGIKENKLGSGFRKRN